MSRAAECSGWLGGIPELNNAKRMFRKRQRVLCDRCEVFSVRDRDIDVSSFRRDPGKLTPLLEREIETRIPVYRTQCFQQVRTEICTRRHQGHRQEAGNPSVVRRVLVQRMTLPPNVELTCDQLMARLLRLQEACHEPDGNRAASGWVTHSSILNENFAWFVPSVDSLTVTGLSSTVIVCSKFSPTRVAVARSPFK